VKEDPALSRSFYAVWIAQTLSLAGKPGRYLRASNSSDHRA